MKRLTRLVVYLTGLVLVPAALCDEPVGKTSPVQAPSFKTLEKIELKTGKVRFGFVLKNLPDYVEVLDIQSNAEVRFRRTEMLFMSSENAEADAVRRVGIPLVLSWKVKQFEHKRVKTGKIAKLDGALVYVTLGKASGIAPGNLLRVYRGEAEIRDPETHEILGRERKLVGELIVADAQNSFSKARLSGEIDVEFKVGDQVEPKSQADALAVLPFTTVSGGDSAVGSVLAEQLTTELAKRGTLVVERAQFARVLEELAIQQSALFDQAKVQELGRLVGAFAVLTGTVAQRGRRTSDVNCRLIEVGSGRVLFSESYRDSPIPVVQPSPVPSTIAGHSAPVQPRSFPQRPANKPPMRAGRPSEWNNSINMKLVRISKGYDLGVHEVTQGQYREVMGSNPSKFQGSDQLPVESVSWLDAVLFCNKLSEREGRIPFYRIDGATVTTVGGNGYRLPSEVEWEYACRAGNVPVDSGGELPGLAWYSGNSGGQTHSVGQKRPNAWGFYDMLGNVWEWCQEANASGNVIRGGSYANDARECQPTRRSGGDSGWRDKNLGFRVARFAE